MLFHHAMLELLREAQQDMEKRQVISILTTLLLFAMVSFGMTSCQGQVQTVLPHKVVANGQRSVKVYPDEEAYLHVARMKGEGGVEGIVGDVKQKLQTKEIEDQTPVQIVTADDNGAVITVTDGPMKGLTGFVPKQYID